MLRRTAVLCFLLLGCSLTMTQVGCYSSSIPASQISPPSPAVNIQHIVVIFEENVSSDHYFGTYPNALNLPGAAATAPNPNEQGWKDVVQCPPNMVTRIHISFDGYPGRYLWHCHVQEHEANDMMRPYVILK